MFHDPIVLLVWALFPPLSAVALSLLPNRFTLYTPLAQEQSWGCRAVALALVFASAHFRVLVDSSDLAARVVGIQPWAYEGLLLALLVVQTAPTILLLRLYSPPRLPRIGLTAERAVFLAAAAAAGYFLLVFLDSAVRSHSSTGWDGLYTGQVWANFYRFPLTHGLALIMYSVVGAGAEEVVFRGFSLLPLARVIGPAGGIAATALFWSMAHLDVTRITGLFAVGVVLGWLFYRTGSLVPSITFHVLLNLGASSDFVFGRLRAAGVHWTNQQHFLYIGVGSLCLSLVFALTAYAQRHRSMAKDTVAARASLGGSRREAKTKRPRLP